MILGKKLHLIYVVDFSLFAVSKVRDKMPEKKKEKKANEKWV